MNNQEPHNLINSAINFNVMSSLKTGNPILDMLISTAVLSLVGLFVTYLLAFKDHFLEFVRNFFARPWKSEIVFYGEELRDNKGSVHRRYPDVFQAILHHINETCKQLSHLEHLPIKTYDLNLMQSYAYIKSQNKNEEEKEKIEPLTYLPKLDQV